MVNLGVVIYCEILRHRRKKYQTEKHAKLSAAIYMAFPLVIIFDFAQDVIAKVLRIPAPIEHINKWIYLFGVYGVAVYLVHRLYGAPSRLGEVESCLDRGGRYSGRRTSFIVLGYYLLPLTLWVWYFYLS